MDSSDAMQLLILVILLALSAFFSSAETALTCVNKIRIRGLAEEGDKRAILVKELTDNPSKMLSAILIGNNIVNLSASSLSTMLATKIAAQLGAGTNTATFVGLATGILTILILIFGEITPKSAATINAEKIALGDAAIIYWLTRILTPAIFVINHLSYGVMRLMGINPNAKTKAMTENELLTVIDVSHEDGVIESEEKEMITNVVDFGDSVASDVMVPRIDIEFMDVESNYEEVLSVFRRDKYSRVPVYEGDKDHVIGVLNLKDVFCYNDIPDNFSIRKILRRPYFTYEFKRISDLMVDMQKNSISMAMVLDEYGAVAGLITLEDLLEEIVGEIRDEYDEEETDDIRKVNDHEYTVDGTTKLDDIDKLLGLHLESEDYDSIAGHMIHELGHIPTEGEYIDINGIRFTVMKMDKHRIADIDIHLPEAESEHNASEH
ncbi:HlyC/CorC family transporter [Coprococcus catus]|uniref:HlyC/CorC family transporter n=1 Tax=Coprococcus catus TaxID=116085 RepID=UPI0015BCFEDE|nr:hemolysin family protein [Coprococcus catus]MBX9232368.1 HlyC/CorC family transporter [Coprococcus catus]MCT6799453.1 HlyC/CorC family transporter [Coprococcus catus]